MFSAITKGTTLITNKCLVTEIWQGWHALAVSSLETESKVKTHGIPVETTVHQWSLSDLEIETINT